TRWVGIAHPVRLAARDPGRLAARLRQGTPPVFCRVADDAILLDLRTVMPGEDDLLIRALRYALREDPAP
ncbi:MAG TPA: hypothetical protein VM638_06810, partial [Actinomycetota bacterium]|nr:hypothetical protein [Actinomycetota bacterium]